MPFLYISDFTLHCSSGACVFELEFDYIRHDAFQRLARVNDAWFEFLSFVHSWFFRYSFYCWAAATSAGRATILRQSSSRARKKSAKLSRVTKGECPRPLP